MDFFIFFHLHKFQFSDLFWLSTETEFDNEQLMPVKICHASNVEDIAEQDVMKCFPCQGNVWLSLQSFSADSYISVPFS